MSRTPGLMGRLPVRPVALGDLTHYLTQPLPAPPAEVEAPDLVYPMAGNDVFGDCTLAACIHADQASASQTREQWTYAGTQAVVREYFKLTGGQDTGLAESLVLQTWQQEGLFGEKLAAFAPLAVKHTQTIKQAVSLCGAVYTGVLVPAPAQQQFQDGQPWDLTGTPADSEIEGGHAVPILGYNATGPVVCTWARLQQATWRWWLEYAEECYALITAEVKERGSLRGVDFAALEADLGRLERA